MTTTPNELAPAATPAAPQGDPAPLGDSGLRALAAERQRADAAEKLTRELSAQLKTIEDAGLSDLDKLRAELATSQAAHAQLAADSTAAALTITRLNVGLAEGLSPELIDRLRGTDEDSIRADAVALKALVPTVEQPNPFPKADPSQGPRSTTGSSNTAEQFASALTEILN